MPCARDMEIGYSCVMPCFPEPPHWTAKGLVGGESDISSQTTTARQSHSARPRPDDMMVMADDDVCLSACPRCCCGMVVLNFRVCFKAAFRTAGRPGMVQVLREHRLLCLSLWGARISFQFLAHFRVDMILNENWQPVRGARWYTLNLTRSIQFTDACLVSLSGRPTWWVLALPIFADWVKMTIKSHRMDIYYLSVREVLIVNLSRFE